MMARRVRRQNQVECQVTIELNTSGWRKSVGECYPRPQLLACCAHYGVPVTLASDAHTPLDVASRFAEAIQLLVDVGYTEIATFVQRHRRMVSLT